MRRAPRTLYILLAVLCFAGLLKATLPQIGIGKWTSTSNLAQARSNSASVLLADGRILIIGGENSNGPLASAEIFGADGTVSSAGLMNAARSRHFGVMLRDGRVLVGGGTTSGGGTTNSAEIYDPAANSWTQINPLMTARANATAALLQDGRVLIAGGDHAGVPSNTIEIYDPSTGNFSFAATLSTSRTRHAMAVLQDGRVLIAGGFDGTNPLSSSDIYDASSGNISAGPNLATARYAASATTLLNGDVAVIGGAGSDGNGGTTDLGSIEIFDSSSAAFKSAGTSLANAREGHQAFLLPNNNNVLVVGGSSGGTALASSESLASQISTSDGSWSYVVSGTGILNTAHAGASGSANQKNGPTFTVPQKPGLVIVAGGTDASGVPLASTEAYGYATVQSDQGDYPPGTNVKITGSGFQPNENVNITLVESPLIDTHGPYTVQADANGNITDSSFTTDLHDLNVRFWLTAVGSQSGVGAQNTFTDSQPNKVTVGNQSPTPISPGASAQFLVSVTFTGNGSACTSPLSVQSGLPSGTGSSFSPSSVTNTNPNSTLTITTSNTTPPGPYTFTVLAANGGGTCQSGTGTGTGNLAIVENTTTTLATSLTPSVSGQSITLTATVAKLSGQTTPTGGTVTFLDGANQIGTATLSNGTASLPTSTLSVGSHSLTASYAGVASTFGSSTSSAVTQVLNQANTTTAVASGANPSNFGQSVTFTATVAAVAPGAGNPTGTVTFKDGATTIGSGSLSTNAGVTTATFSTSTIALGGHSITAVYGSDPNFTGSTSATLTQTVNQASTTTAVTSSVNPSVFGQPVTFTATVTPSGSGTPTGTVTFKDGGTTLGTGNLSTTGGVTTASFSTSSLSLASHSMTAVYGADSNFTGSTSSVLNQNVTQASTTVTETSSANPAVFGQPITFTVTVAPVAPSTGTPTGTVQLKNGQNNVVGTGTLSGGQASILISNLAVGTSGIKAFYLGDTNFSANNTQNAISQVVNEAATTTTVAPAISPSTYGQAVTFTATIAVVAPGAGTPSGTVTFKDGANTFGTGNVSTNVGITTATFTTTNTQLTAGSHLITATYNGDTNFSTSTSSTLTQTVNPASVTATVTANDKSYDGTTAATQKSCTLTGVLTGDIGSVTCSAATLNFIDKNVTTGKTVNVSGITLAGTAAGNYQLSTTTASTTASITARAITVTAATNSKQYDGTNLAAATPTLTSGSLAAGDTASFTESYGTKNIGTNLTLTPSGAVTDGNSGNNYAVTFVNNTTGVITARPITVTAAANSKQYDGTNSAAATPTITSRSLASGDTANFTEAYTSKNAGTGLTLVPTGSVSDGNNGSNYAVTFANNTSGVITARPITVTAASNTKEYDGTTSAAATPTITSGSVASGDTTNFTEAYTSKNAGTGLTLVPTGSVSDGNNGGNYALTFVNNITGLITARVITITAATDTKVYDGTVSSNGVPTITSGSLVAGDTSNFTQSFDSKNAGTRTLTASGSVSDSNAGNNYSITFKTTTGSITAKPLTVTATGISKQYDGTTAATVSLTDNRISGDVFTDSYASAVFSNKNAGTSKTITVSGISIVGTDASNYSLGSTTTTTSADIAARALIVTATGVNKQYDGTTAATVTLADNRLPGDSIVGSYTSATFADANSGSGKNVSVLGISISGSDSANYSLQNTTASTTADITPAVLTLAVTGASGTYNALPYAAVCRVASGLVGSDSVILSLTYSSVAAPVNVGSYTATCTSSGNPNYSPANAQAQIEITSAPLTITANNATKNFGDIVTFVGTEFRATGLLGSDSVTSVTLTSPGTDPTANVAGSPYPISPSAAVGTGLANYTINYVNGTVTVNKATFTGTIVTTADDPKNVAYGQPLTATVHLRSYSVGGVPLLQPHQDPNDPNTQLPESVTVYLALGGGNASQAVKFGTATAVPTYDNTTNTSGTTKTGWTATITANAPIPGTYNAFVYGDDTGDNSLVNANLVDVGYFYPDTADITYPILQSAQIDVVQAKVNGSFTVSDKLYDTTTAATIATRFLAGVLGQDDVTLTGGIATFSDKNVGNGKTVTGTGFTLSGADAAKYQLPSSTITTIGNITPATLTGSFTAESKTYDAKTTAMIGTRSLSGVQGSDTVNLYGGSATFSDKNVGTGKMVTGTGFSLTGVDARNYTLVSTTLTTTADITALHIIGSFTAANKVYDGTTAAKIVTESVSPIAGDALSLTGGTATFLDKDVGTGKTVSLTGATLIGTDSGNYVLDSVSTTTADVTPLHITGSFTAANKTYDGTATASVTNRTLNGAISGDVVYLYGGTAAFSDKNVGTAKTVTLTGATLSGTDSSNYVLDSVATTTASVTALHIVGMFTAQSKQYDGNASATVLTRSLVGAITGDAASLYGGTATFLDKNVGTGKTVSLSGATLSGTDAGNYILDSVDSAKADIAPRPLTVTATGINKVYDGTTAATVTLGDDRVAGDVLTDSYTSAAFSDKNVGNGKIVSVNGISISGGDAANYSLSNRTPSTTANITPKPLTVTATGVSKQYDGMATATVTLSDDRISGDMIIDSYASATFSNKNVGSGKSVSVSGISISGTDAGNYSLQNMTANTTADVTPRPLTITATGVDKIYDGMTVATVKLSDNRVSGDVFTDTYAGANFGDKNAGTGKPVTVTGISISGTDTTNYSLSNTTTNTTANITALAITGSVTAANKVYDGTTAATIASRTLTGAITGDAVSYFGGTAAFSDKNVGTAKTVTATGLSLSGADAGNYTVNSTATTTANITPAPITVMTDPQTKIFGQQDPTFTYKVANGAITALFAGDSFAGSLTRTSGENVGTYSILQGTLSAGPDYTITYVGANLTITVASSQTTILSSVPSVFGQPVTFTATVKDISPQSNGIPTGSVQFYIDGNAYGTAVGLSVGSASIVTGSLSVSTAGHTIYAQYSGDQNFTVSTSNAVSQVVNKASTVVSVSSSSPTSIFNAPVTFTATITVSSPGAGTPSGTVSFYLDSTTGTQLGTANVANGKAAITSSAVPVNSHPIVALYSGDGNFTGNNGLVTQLVQYQPLGTMCAGDVGHQIRQPINADGSSVWKQGSTVPAKFAICDINGVSIATANVITSFALYRINGGTINAVDETAINSTNDLGWHFDPTAQQWIFNMSTKTAPQNVANQTYYYQILLNDGTSIYFNFGLK